MRRPYLRDARRAIGLPVDPRAEVIPQGETKITPAADDTQPART
jgi:hypothetical protein